MFFLSRSIVLHSFIYRFISTLIIHIVKHTRIHLFCQTEHVLFYISGFDGVNCEISVNPCASLPCVNRGHCQVGSESRFIYSDMLCLFLSSITDCCF